jgi:hypothetical protein
MHAAPYFCIGSRAQRAGGKVGLLQSEELSKGVLEGRPCSGAQVVRTADAGEYVPQSVRRSSDGTHTQFRHVPQSKRRSSDGTHT